MGKREYDGFKDLSDARQARASGEGAILEIYGRHRAKCWLVNPDAAVVVKIQKGSHVIDGVIRTKST